MDQIKLEKESLTALKGKLGTIKDEFNTSSTEIKTNLETIKESWKGKRATETLSKVEELNKRTANLLTKLQENVDYIESVIQTVDKANSVEVEDKANSNQSERYSQTPIPTIIPSPGLSAGTYSNTSLVDSKTYMDEYMNSVIEDLKRGISPFSKENMAELSLTYNQNGTVRDLGYEYFKDSEKALEALQARLKTERDANGNTLWGTPAATQAVMHFMLKTGFKIPSYPTKKTDTVGNYRYVGLNSGWLDQNNGLDCNNFSTWLNINSGRMEENTHFYTQPETSNSIRLYRPSTINSYTGGEAGDLLARNDHVGSYMYEDENYIYVIEAVNIRKNATPGTLVTMLPKDGKSTGLGPTSVLYPSAHFNYIVKEDDIQIVKNPATYYN